MTLQLRRVARHTFIEAWPLWLMVAGFVVAAAVFRAAGPTWASGVLEVAGLGTVAWGLHRLRTDFRRPGGSSRRRATGSAGFPRSSRSRGRSNWKAT